MRRWGLIVTLFYAAAVLLLIIPMAVVLVGEWKAFADIHSAIKDVYHYWLTWVCVGVFISGQALLLFLSVDTSDRRFKPRTRIAFSVATAGLLLAVLTFSAVSSIAVAIRGDSADSWARAIFIGGLFVPWLLWAVVFYWYSRRTEDIVARAVCWLIRGSVLELLIAIPSHVIVRRRDDCCAPVVTGFGIASGIAVMLLSFGPSVLFLYKRRMASLKPRAAAAAR
jgi:hypothetical protein